MSKLGHFVRRAFLFALSFSLLISPIAHAEVHIPREAEFAENGIVFYNPNSCGSDGGYYGQCSGGADNIEKIICYFSGNNPFGIQLPSTGIAGILANISSESAGTFSPFVNQSGNGPAYGIFQFDPRSKILGPLQSDPRSAPYFNDWYTPDVYDIGPQAPVEANDAFLFVELDFAVQSEFNTTTLGDYRHMGGEMGLDYLSDNLTIIQAMQQAQSASDAARVFVWIYERPKDKPGGAATRSQKAEEFLPQVEALIGSGRSSGIPNTTSSSGNGTTLADNGDNITMIGDSLTVGAQSIIESMVPGIYIDGLVGRHFSDVQEQGIYVLKNLVNSGNLRDILVFALGTNDPGGVTSTQAQEVVDLAGPDRQVIFVTNYTNNGNDYTSNNNVFRQMANSNSNVIVADFAGSASTDPAKYISSDLIHHTEDGKRLFAEVIFNGVTLGTSGNSRTRNNCPGSGNGISGNTALISGGMTLDEAIQWMTTYRSEALLEGTYGGSRGENATNGSTTFLGGYIHGPIGKHGLLNNCSAFSMWFANKYGNAGMTGTMQGEATANHLIGKGWSRSTVPVVYSVFSYPDGFRGGQHTGVVLGIDVDSDTMIIGEASWSGWQGPSSPQQYPPGDASSDYWLPRISVESISRWNNSGIVTYAYKEGLSEP